MLRWSRFGVFLLVLVLGGAYHAAAQEGYTPRFEPGECATAELQAYRAESEYEMECGELVVPEDRSLPEGRMVRLPVVIFRTNNPNPAPDPLIYLAGGGGNNQLSGALYYLEQVGRGILETRDFIQYNQRGAPLTDPALDCPGFSDLLWDLASQPLTPAERTAQQVAFLTACRATYVEQGIDLSMYNSAANAADARDLRIALGYEQANYYGTSYGTRLGLTLLRDYPDGVRSMILDSVYPPAVDYYTELAPNTYRALQVMFDRCAADVACSQKYPDLETTFFDTVDRLNETPARRRLGNQQILLDGGLFMEAIDLHLYSVASLGHVPAIITAASHGDYSALDGPIYGLLTSLPTDINWVMFYSMQCREEVPFESRDQMLARAADLPPQVGEFWVERFPVLAFDLCDQWQMTPADPLENEPVISDVPTLVLAGQFDSATPPAWSQLAAETLSNSYYFEFPGLSHGVMRADACGLAIGLAFLDDPTTAPDVACVTDQRAITFE